MGVKQRPRIRGEDKPWAMVKCESDPRGSVWGHRGLSFPQLVLSIFCLPHCVAHSLSCWLYWSPSGLYAGLKHSGCVIRWAHTEEAHPAFLQAWAIPAITASVVWRVKFSTGKVIKEKEGALLLGPEYHLHTSQPNPDQWSHVLPHCWAIYRRYKHLHIQVS